MEQSIQKKGLVNWLLLLLLGGASAVAAVYAHSATGVVGAVFMGMGFLVASICYFQMRLEAREKLEQLEFDEMKKSVSSATLFAEQAEDTFPARQSREQFERYFVPAFTILLFLLEGAAVWWLWRYVGQDTSSSMPQASVAMAMFALFALVFFQFGKYSAVLARLQRQRLLRPQASHLLLGALLSVAAALVEVAGWAGYPKVDIITARVLTVVLGLVAAENLLALVFEIYRPRLKGQAEHPLYESRLIGLLSQPGGLVTTAAQALDYQFGFRVSETWFYRFIEKALAWMVLLQLGLLFLSTTVVFIEPGEQGLLERFGRLGSPLEPGPHFKLPWPIDTVRRQKTEAIQSFTVGIVHNDGDEHDRVMVWSVGHAKEEFNMLVASRPQPGVTVPTGEQTVPVNLLAVNIPIQYQVSDVRAFAYDHADAGKLLELIANSEVSRYLVSVDSNEIMAVGRQKAAEELRQRIQARADKLKLGVRILFVGLHGVHPPVKVAKDFENVVGADQEKEAARLFAQAYKAERVPMARAEAAKKTNEAEAYRLRTVAAATATAARFTNQVTAFKASPDVYRWRTYLDTMGRAVASARKYVIVATNTQEVVTLNLEDKIRSDLTDVMMSNPGKK